LWVLIKSWYNKETVSKTFNFIGGRKLDLNTLKESLTKKENLHAEFKEWPVHPDDLAAEIIAFANTDGGLIFLGVDDQGRITGISELELDRVTRAVDNVAFNNCEPPVTIIQETAHDEAGRLVLSVNIPQGAQRPYRTNRGVYYVRTSSGRRQASREELLRLFQGAESLYYDEIPIGRSRIGDLSEQAIEKLLQNIQGQGVDVAGIAKERLLFNWHLLHKGQAEICPTVAGILFLARNPQYFLPHTYVSALRIPGTDISMAPLDQKRIEGRLDDILEDTLRFLNIHLMRPHKIEGLKPEVKPEIPVAALREALVNALAHRDYMVTGPVRVIVYDDRLEIRTPGLLPNSVAIEALKLGVHVLRNPTIYNIFLKIGLVTDAGSGIPRIIHLLRQSTGSEPEFRLEGNEFVVALKRGR
jgi:ATP-dependent DNA helicase RecG